MTTQTHAPLDVVYIRDHLVPSGGTTYLVDTLPRFDPARAQVSLCVLQNFRPHDASAVWWQESGIPTSFIGRSKRNPWHLFRFGVSLRRRKPDLVVLSGPKSMILGGGLTKVLGIPSSTHFNNMIALSNAMMWTQRQFISGTTSVAVSNAVRHWASSHYHLPLEQIEVIRPGRDLTRFATAAGTGGALLRAALGIPPHAPIIALVGRLLVAQKGQDLMIQAMPALLRRHPETVLLVVGDGPDRRSLEAMIQDMGLGQAARLLGHRENVAEILAAADLAVVPSVCEEAFGFGVLEGWSAGVPVVAFASGGLPELLQHRTNGLLVPKSDVVALVDTISELLANPGLAIHLTAAGRQSATRFTVDRHVATLTDCYTRIVADFRRAQEGPAIRTSGS